MCTQLCSSDCPCSSGIVSGSVSQVSCIAFKRLNTVLNNVFGDTEFRHGQLQAMLPALHGKDTVVKMATGAGKSLCMFMVPLAYSDTAVGIIVSPLNSLMDEQVHTILHINCSVMYIAFFNRSQNSPNLAHLQSEPANPVPVTLRMSNVATIALVCLSDHW